MTVRMKRAAAAAFGVLGLAWCGGCAPWLARPYKPVGGRPFLDEVQAASAHVLDTTCVEANIRRSRLGWLATTKFRIRFRVDRVVKGDFREPAVALAWQETEWVGTRVEPSIVYWFREGRRFRLFAGGLCFGRLTGLKISELEEARKCMSRTIEHRVKLLGDERPEFRREAAKRLGAYGADAHGAVGDLEKLYDDPDEDVRAAARQAVRALRAATAKPTTGPAGSTLP